LVLFTEDINRDTSHIFTCIRDKDGWSIQEKHDYNMETLRIEKAGGDISKRKIFKMYFGTTCRDVEDVSFCLNHIVVCAMVLWSCVHACIWMVIVG